MYINLYTMPLYGTHEQRYMGDAFGRFQKNKEKINVGKNKEKIVDGVNRIADIYYKELSINKLEKKINKTIKLLDFLENCHENECFVVKEYDEIYDEDIYEEIEELDELDKLENSDNEIYHMDSYSYQYDKNKYRCWVYKREILEYMDICLYKIYAMRKAINLHNINVGVSLALLRKNH